MEGTVGLIYETVADPALWGDVTRAIGAEVGATAAWMFQVDSLVRGWQPYGHVGTSSARCARGNIAE